MRQQERLWLDTRGSGAGHELNAEERFLQAQGSMPSAGNSQCQSYPRAVAKPGTESVMGQPGINEDINVSIGARRTEPKHVGMGSNACHYIQVMNIQCGELSPKDQS